MTQEPDGTTSTFVVDAMLGTLATWLRILGYDTRYDPAWDDNLLARVARAQSRILLTRDTELARRPGLQILLIASDILEEQLVQVTQTFSLTADHAFSRCPVCNHLIRAVPKHEAWGQVPSYVYMTQNDFRLCPECGRFFWRGSHWQRIIATLDRSSS